MMSVVKAAAAVVFLTTSVGTVVHGWTTPSCVSGVTTFQKQTSSTRLLMSPKEAPDLTGKTVYQRIIYKLKSKDTDSSNGFSIEERVRFRPSVEDEGYMEPMGRRTLILRAPSTSTTTTPVGPELYRMDVHESSGESHSGAAGNDLQIEADICTSLYLAANPDLLVGNVLDLQCQLGLAGLLGSIAAGFASQDEPVPLEKEDELGISKPSPLPESIKSLLLVDSSEDMVNLAFANAKNSGVEASKVNVDEIDWIRQRRPSWKQFHIVLGSDIYVNFPIARALARTVAYAVEPEPWGKGSAASRFVLVHRDNNDDISYLKRFLSKGYLMNLDTEYLKLEKLLLQPSIVDAAAQESASDFESKHLEPVTVQMTRQSSFACLTALHNLDYSGDNGDFFFPMENGAYDGGGGGTALEREWSTK